MIGSKRGPVIVVGNEKGGSGKSTTAMHLIVALLQTGRSVASIDLDVRQASLSRYVSNREGYRRISGRDLGMPHHYVADGAGPNGASTPQQKDQLALLIEGARVNHDVVVVDTPGSDSPLSQFGHSFADILITPVNDSFLDLDVLGHMDPRNLRVIAPSHYAESVMLQRRERQERGAEDTDWIVMRNRLSNLDAHNKRDVERVLAELSERVGFRTIPGFAELVIYRELFLVGLTIMDLKDATDDNRLTLSHLAARQEVRSLVEALGLS